MYKKDKVNILLVEDNPGDITLYEEAFEESDFPSHVSVVRDGQEAVDYLSQSDGFADSVMPDIILLDINLPKKSGIEVLGFIKSSPHLKMIPTIMMTSSHDRSDIARAYDRNANCYIVKPIDALKFMHVVQQVQSFWTKIACLPDTKQLSSV